MYHLDFNTCSTTEKAENSISVPVHGNVEIVREKMDNAWDKFNEIESAKDNTKEIELVALDTSPDKDIKWVFLYSFWLNAILQKKQGRKVHIF